MIAIRNNPKYSYPSNAAVIVGDGLLCYQCVRKEAKQRDIARLPFLIRWKKRIDNATGIFSAIKRTRGSVNKWWYLKVCGNAPHGRA